MSFPQIPFETTDCSRATWRHMQTFHRQRSWNTSSVDKLHPTFPWYDGSPKAASHTKQPLFTGVFKAEQLHMRVGMLKSLLVCSRCWAGYLSYFYVCPPASWVCVRNCLEKYLKSQLGQLDTCDSWLTFKMSVYCEKWVCKTSFLEEGDACWLQGASEKTARLLPLSQQQTSASLSMILSALVWTERKGRPWKTKPQELILIHFSYIRSRYKAFQNISRMLVSCGWFTGCDRKSISVPVDAKFITLPQNSDSPLLLELQHVAMATSARQYIFFFPLFSIGTVAYCSKNSILLQY